METFNTNNYQFELIVKENDKLVYLSNKIEKRIKDRIEFEKFIKQIMYDFGHSIDNTKYKECTLDASVEYDENKKFIEYLQYKIEFKEDEKMLYIKRLSFGKRWRVKYNFFKVKININLVS